MNENSTLMHAEHFTRSQQYLGNSIHETDVSVHADSDQARVQCVQEIGGSGWHMLPSEHFFMQMECPLQMGHQTGQESYLARTEIHLMFRAIHGQNRQPSPALFKDDPALMIDVGGPKKIVVELRFLKLVRWTQAAAQPGPPGNLAFLVGQIPCVD